MSKTVREGDQLEEKDGHRHEPKGDKHIHPKARLVEKGPTGSAVKMAEHSGPGEIKHR